jgi:hypothetical protein
MLVDSEALSRLEQVCRDMVLRDPCDTLARARLAWCLFLQGVHQAGQESILEGLVGETDAPVLSGGLPPANREAHQLLDECLRQTETVLHLALSGRERSEMEHLRYLTRLCVGDQPVAAAELKLQRILQRLLQDVCRASEVEPSAEEPHAE